MLGLGLGLSVRVRVKVRVRVRDRVRVRVGVRDRVRVRVRVNFRFRVRIRVRCRVKVVRARVRCRVKSCLNFTVRMRDQLPQARHGSARDNMLGIILLVGEIKRSDWRRTTGQKVDSYGSFISGKSLHSRGC